MISPARFGARIKALSLFTIEKKERERLSGHGDFKGICQQTQQLEQSQERSEKTHQRSTEALARGTRRQTGLDDIIDRLFTY